MCYQIINAIGLSLDIIGAILLFFYGPPQPELKEVKDTLDLVDQSEAEKKNIAIKQRRQRHIKFSSIAMVLIIIGFIFQLIALFV